MNKERIFAYVARMNGAPIKALGGSTTFEVEIAGSDLRVTTEDGSSLVISKDDILRVLETYGRSSSLAPGDCISEIRSSQYLLALIRDAEP